MGEKRIDARGLLCPKPLILVKKTLSEAEPEARLEVLLDNATARDNVLRFLQDFHTNPVCGEDQGMFTITAVKGAVALASEPRPEEYCRSGPAPVRPLVIVFSRAEMGSAGAAATATWGAGSQELGRILLQACVNTIKEVTPLPGSLLFYNAGVYLTCEGSPVIGSLKTLEEKGVKLLVCGTCLDYFELKSKCQVGTVSNMLDIMQSIASAGTVFAP